MQATLWVLLTAIGFVVIAFMDRIPQAFLRAVAIRGAAISFVGAGTIGASGWIGSAAAGVLAWANGVGNDFGKEAFGTAALWIVWLVLSAAWVLTMLPESWFKGDIPDGLSVSGLFLPALSVTIPGPVGDFFQRMFEGLGHFAVSSVQRIIGAG
jgi:hypothetical protein